MNKRLVRVFSYYGGSSIGEIEDEFVVRDTKEGRERLFNKYRTGYGDKNGGKFKNKETDHFRAYYYGTECDSLTGRAVIIYDKEEILAGLAEEYEIEVDLIYNLFEEDVVYG